jgi:hypothetical protein
MLLRARTSIPLAQRCGGVDASDTSPGNNGNTTAKSILMIPMARRKTSCEGLVGWLVVGQAATTETAPGKFSYHELVEGGIVHYFIVVPLLAILAGSFQ